MPQQSGDLLSELDGLNCPQCASRQPWELALGPQRRSNSVVGTVACRQCGVELFAKLMDPQDGRDALRLAEQEYSSLTEIHASFPASDQLAVPKPVWRSGPTLAMEKIDGHSPVAVLRSGPTETASRLMARMGAWFATLHDAFGERQGGVDLEKKLCYIESRYPVRGLPLVDVAPALDFLRSRLADVAGRTVCHRRLHGDAKPDNFLVDEDRVVAVDIDGRHWNPPEYDLAQFLTQYEVSASGILGRFDEVRGRVLEAAFVDGYRQQLPVNDPMLDWLRVYFLTSFWVHWRRAGGVRRLRWDLFFHRRTRALLRRIESSRPAGDPSGVNKLKA